MHLQQHLQILQTATNDASGANEQMCTFERLERAHVQETAVADGASTVRGLLAVYHVAPLAEQVARSNPFCLFRLWRHTSGKALIVLGVQIFFPLHISHCLDPTLLALRLRGLRGRVIQIAFQIRNAVSALVRGQRSDLSSLPRGCI